MNNEIKKVCIVCAEDNPKKFKTYAHLCWKHEKELAKEEGKVKKATKGGEK